MTTIFDDARLDRIQHRMKAHTSSENYAGIAWRIGTTHSIVNEGRAGVLPDNAIWRIYSMTKPIVSVAVMQLVEECRIPLHARVTRWFPGFEAPVVLLSTGGRVPAREPITIHQLLCHMAGLSYGFLGDGAGREYAAAGILDDDNMPLQECVRVIAGMPLANQPGERWRYSVATDVLAAILEIESGQSIGDLLREQVFDPLGMKDTGFFVSKEKRDRIVEIHGTPLPPNFPAVPPLGIGAIYPPDIPDFGRGGHGLFSTLDDYAKFAEMLLRVSTSAGSGLISRRTLAAMTTNQVPQEVLPLVTNLPFDSESPGFGGFGFGLGFSVDMGAKSRRLLGSPGCFGWAGAADTWFTVDPEAGFYAVFMSQDLDRGGASTDFQTLLHASVM